MLPCPSQAAQAVLQKRNLNTFELVEMEYSNNIKLTLPENIFRSSNVNPDIDGFFKSISAARSG